MTLLEFVKSIDFEILITKRARPKDPEMQFLASFLTCKINRGRNGKMLKCGRGFGRTVTEAMNSYSDIISGKLVKLEFGHRKMRKVLVPELDLEMIVEVAF